MAFLNRFKFVVLAFAALAVLAVYTFTREPSVSFTRFSPPKTVSEQKFFTTQGELSTADFAGELTIIYIGYTNCPDYCPTTLADLKSVFKELGQLADQVNVVFITVDPNRDSIEKLNAYMSAFDSRFIGAQMDPQVLPLFTRELGLAYSLGEPNENGYYQVDHSTNLMLLDQNTDLIGFWRYATPPGDIASDIKTLLR